MFLPALLFLALAGQQPTQQPAAAPAKPQTNASQQADTSKAKAHRRRAHKTKAATTTAPRDTTKAKP
ncbi:MAG TPA: hypothetical protein VEK77_12510 [Gemmatimonadales bacterium]|nr:hypothetical protein [Gemmatimonadales bacterium]